MPVPAHRVLTGTAAAALAAVLAWDLGHLDGAPPGRVALGWALTLTGCGALYWRLRWPVPVAVVVLLCNTAYYPLAQRDWPLLLLALALALYTVAVRGRLAAAVALAAVTLLAVVAGEHAAASDARHVDNLALFLLAGLVAVGRALRVRQAYAVTRCWPPPSPGGSSPSSPRPAPPGAGPTPGRRRGCAR
ncbi:hypothetical protein V1J52_02750 [Streptomyces sp. TRM 70351]|uniref:hypothetical protein n=1 Tax=Streptomyces sp. TRM 70351 TaxID=3116552 RepID=UPI002E7B91FA|nr:hypothetical protein [Streptomyces sp. TRM 70351]MEE1927109.1 hypothetical protein [Streptomyces sp. TRM 70351]